MPQQCEYIPYRQWTFNKNFSVEGLLCENIFDDTMMRQLASAWRGCPFLQSSITTFSIKSSTGRKIIDKSFGVFNLTNYLPKLELPIIIRFLDFNGLDTDSIIKFRMIRHLMLDLNYINLYKQNSLVKDCIPFEKSSNSQEFIFQRVDGDNYIEFLFITNKKTVYPICSLFFRNAFVKILQFYAMTSSYMFKNMISFSDPIKIRSDFKLNSNIKSLTISYSYQVDLDSRFINRNIFANTSEFLFNYQLNSIDANVFKFSKFSLKKLRSIYLNPLNFIELVRKQGIEWIKNINWDLNVNMTNQTDLDENENRLVFFFFLFDRDYVLSTSKHFAYDKDFCLFADFPFHQLVFVIENIDIVKYKIKIKERYLFSCSELWLYKYYGHYSFIYQNFTFWKIKNKLDASNFTACNFEKRFEMCNKTGFNSRLNSSSISEKFSMFNFLIVSEFSLIILSPLLAAYAIVTNLITIYVIYHKKNEKTMREKHYIYMSFHCISNAIICLINILSLINECQNPFGFYFYSIQNLKEIKYLKINF